MHPSILTSQALITQERKVCNVKDRISTYPDRYAVVHEDGTKETVTITRDDHPTQYGTLLNSANLLGADALALLGLSAEAVPTDAFKLLAQRTLDTGWIDLWTNKNPATDSRVTVVSYANQSSYAPMYRKIGSVVTLKGVVTPAASGQRSHIIGKLPVGFYPEGIVEQELNTLCQGSYMNRWMLHITSAGDVVASRYGPGDNTSIGTTIDAGTWMPFNFSYVVD